jgi:large subunit ribosomal protein L4
MADLPVLGGSKRAKPPAGVLEERFHGPLVHQSVRAEQAARRRGTAATKTRAMVSGGGAKPWRQKGTGRARAGSTRSPIWTGGGTVFGPQPRSYTFKVNRKEHRAALRSALSLHASRSTLAVLDPAVFSDPKTSQARDLLEDWSNAGSSTLVVLSPEDRNAALSFRNLPRVVVMAHAEVGVADIVAASSLLVTKESLAALAARARARPRGVAAGDAASAAVVEPAAKPKPAKAAKAAEEPKAAEAVDVAGPHTDEEP